ncbi:MAG: NAD-dependent epimerase/dehydratase family protein [Rhodocyclales bacterium]|nr:NAD-dependent epimerase/dehydratase family protein [Rhodocyclales bacterium]
MNPHVLVTGGSGFLGQALCAALIAQGLRVTAMVRRPDATLPSGVARWVAPELPSLAVDAVQQLATINVVVHAAGRAHMLRDPADDPLAAFRQVNTDGTLALARAAAEAGVARFIFVSSIGVNGSQSIHQPFTADDHPQPDSPYALSKWEAEQALNQLQASTGMSVLCVRPPMIYGPAAPGNFALLTRLVAKGWPLPLGALNAPRSFVALDNVVDLLMHMVRHPNPPSGVYLVADGQVTTATQFIRAMAQGMGQNLSLLPVPATWLQMLMSLVGRGEQMRKMSVPLALDIQATVSRLGWTPPRTMAVAMKRAFSAIPTALPPQEF